MTVRRVTLSSPMPHQREVLLSPARHKLLVCGRRWGKTSLARGACLEGHGPERGWFPGALHGAHVAWVVPAFPSVVEVWRQLKDATRGAWTDKSETEHRIELPGKGVVLVRSGEEPDSLRGFKFNGAVIDEAASQKEEVWKEALAPALSDSQGWAMFLGTPKGVDNWFYERYVEAANLEDWQRWQRPSSDNPLMTEKELEARKRESGSYVFAREYLAEFVVRGGGMFGPDGFRWYDQKSDRIFLGDESCKLEDLDRFATVDLAATTKTYSDYSVVSSWAATKDKRLILLEVVREKMEGPKIIRTMERARDRWNLSSIWIEKTAYHIQLIQQARAEGLPVMELVADKDKVTRSEPAAAALEGGLVWFPRTASWLNDFTTELLAFPDSSSKDDMVDTFSYAVSVMWSGRRSREVEDCVTVEAKAPTIQRYGVKPLPSLLPGSGRTFVRRPVR